MNRLFAQLSLFLAAFGVTSAGAESNTIMIAVEAPFEPTSAVGLIINETATIQKTDATFSRGKHNEIIVAFPFREAEAKGGAMATAMVIAEDGMMAFGEMKPIESAEQRMVASELPDCPPEKMKTVGLESQMGLLQKLLDVRAARRANVQTQIKDLLTPEFRSQLEKLEKGFGYVNARPLSENLPPLELNERLSRITAALLDYRGAKKRAEAAQSAAAQAATEKAAAEAATMAETAPE